MSPYNLFCLCIEDQNAPRHTQVSSGSQISLHRPLKAGAFRERLHALAPTKKPLIEFLILLVHIVKAIVPAQAASAARP